MLALGTEFCFIYADIAGTGLLPVEAENQGKLVITTELGGGECIPASVHRIAQSGLKNALIHIGALKGREQPRTAPAIITQATNRDDYLLAPESGIFEVALDLGAKVKKGQAVGWIHHLERPDRAPEQMFAASSGYLITMRAPCLTQQGDCVAVIAKQVSEREVLRA
jgi:predicted deacylase